MNRVRVAYAVRIMKHDQVSISSGLLAEIVIFTPASRSSLIG